MKEPLIYVVNNVYLKNNYLYLKDMNIMNNQKFKKALRYHGAKPLSQLDIINPITIDKPTLRHHISDWNLGHYIYDSFIFFYTILKNPELFNIKYNHLMVMKQDKSKFGLQFFNLIMNDEEYIEQKLDQVYFFKELIIHAADREQIHFPKYRNKTIQILKQKIFSIKYDNVETYDIFLYIRDLKTRKLLNFYELLNNFKGKKVKVVDNLYDIGLLEFIRLLKSSKVTISPADGSMFMSHLFDIHNKLIELNPCPEHPPWCEMFNIKSIKNYLRIIVKNTRTNDNIKFNNSIIITNEEINKILKFID